MPGIRDAWNEGWFNEDLGVFLELHEVT